MKNSGEFAKLLFLEGDIMETFLIGKSLSKREMACVAKLLFQVTIFVKVTYTECSILEWKNCACKTVYEMVSKAKINVFWKIFFIRRSAPFKIFS